jgi:hypothetical protein
LSKAKKIVFTVKKIAAKAMIAMNFYRPELLGVGCVMQYAGIQYPDIARMLTPENSIRFIFQIFRSIRDYAVDFQRTQSHDTDMNSIGLKLQEMTSDDYATHVYDQSAQYPAYNKDQWKRVDQRLEASQLAELMKTKRNTQQNFDNHIDDRIMSFIDALPNHDPLQNEVPVLEIRSGQGFTVASTTAKAVVQEFNSTGNFFIQHIEKAIQRDLKETNVNENEKVSTQTESNTIGKLVRKKRFLFEKKRKTFYTEGPLNNHQIVSKVIDLEHELAGQSYTFSDPKPALSVPYPVHGPVKHAESRIQHNSVNQQGPVYAPAPEYGVPSATYQNSVYHITTNDSPQPNFQLPSQQPSPVFAALLANPVHKPALEYVTPTIYQPTSYENSVYQPETYENSAYQSTGDNNIDTDQHINVNYNNDYGQTVHSTVDGDYNTWDMKLEKFILKNFVTTSEDMVPPSLWKCAQVYGWESAMRVFTSNFL